VSQPKRSQAETVISSVGDRDGGTDPTELIKAARQVIYRPNGACNTTTIISPSRIWLGSNLAASIVMVFVRR
jgi:hypothetical protein